jgi:hypothetical protein
MPRLSLGLGVQSLRKIKSGGAAPSGIPLTAPTIYLSGLLLQDQDPFYNGIIANPYTLVTPGYWEDAYATGFVQYSVTKWNCRVYGSVEGSPNAILVATNTALPTSLPTTGWTNTSDYLIVSGTLVISTTP